MKRYHIDYLNENLNTLNFDEISIHQIGRRFCEAGESIDDHLHLNWFELTIVTGGEGYIYSNGKGTLAASGDIYLSLPSDIHRIVSGVENPLRYDFFSFSVSSPEFESELNKITMELRSPDARVFMDERISTLVSIAISEIADEKQAFFRNELLSCILSEIVIRLIRNCAGKRVKPPTMHSSQADLLCHHIMNYIDTHIFTLKNLGSLSEITNYNYSYLSALFKRVTGSNISDYFRESKLKKARLLLKDEHPPKISEVADLLGYSSVYVFSRAYKTRYGVSPSVDKISK